MRNNAAYLPESPIVYIILPKSIRNRASFGIFAGLKKYRYEGWLAGGGISAGYHWMLDNHWNIETSLGVGYDFIRYKQYNCVKECAGLRDKGDYHYIGPSKASISLVYLF